MSKLFAKLFNLSPATTVQEQQVDDAQFDVSPVRPHELSYTGGGGIPDLLQ
ncbi:MAG: hypothetical protein ACK5UX_10895 [Burkholderiales bacterium]